MIRLIPLCIFFALLAFPVRAALVFEKTSITLEPGKPLDHLDTEFPFKTDGNAPVTVTAITSTCDCTVPTLEKKSYAPGEKGTLKVRFNVGERKGPQNRSVTVVTDAGSHTLTLQINLPVRSLIAPRLHLFTPIDRADKISTVTYFLDLPVVITSVTSSDPAFTVSSTVENEGSVYKLTAHVVDPAAKTSSRATVRVRSQGASGKFSLDTYFLRFEPVTPGS